MKRLRLGLIVPDINDGTSWYRCAGPLRHLARFVMPELEFAPLYEPLSWASFLAVDAVFIQRPFSHMALDCIRTINEMGVPCWIDADDDIQDLPPEHRSFLPYQKVSDQIKEILSRADAISVSTEALAAKLRPQTKASIHLIPNAVDESFCAPSPARDLNPLSLCWRGSDTHREDIELARGLFTREDLSLHYWGHLPPWYRWGRDVVTPWLAPPRFLRELALCKAGAMAVPLVDHPFNRARSNCSWLEATWAGLAYAHWNDSGEALPEFARPGILTLEELERAGPQDLADARATSLKYIEENLTLAHVNPLRATLLRTMMGRK